MTMVPRMNALILDGAQTLRDVADEVGSALARELESRGHVVARRELAALDIPDCKGDFGCWTVTPGECVQHGVHRDLARDIVRSDLLAWICPVTFGGYSSALKRVLDHCIPLISHRFTKVDGETHHEPRYERFPALLAVGLLERPDPGESRVFERLVRRNVLNVYAPRYASPVFARTDRNELPARVCRWLDQLAASSRPRSAAEPLELGARTDLPATVPRRALMLVGSPRGAGSVSSALASHLGACLVERGVAVGSTWIHRSLHADPELHELVGQVREADVVVLATPLYVDSLPAPVTRTLEILARERASVGSRARFLAIVNCGFPEAVHTDTGVAICRCFAEHAQLDWIGGLGIGGGGMLEGKPLAELGGRARGVTTALELTAEAIAAGGVVPAEAVRLARKPAIPAWIYRLAANWGFRREARKHGAGRRLGARPYVG